MRTHTRNSREYRFLASLLALFVALALGTAIAQETATTVDPDEVVIEIGPDETVTFEEFETEFDRAMRSLAAQQGLPYTSETRELFDRFRADFLTQYATQQALLQEAEARGITVSDEELDQEIDRVRENLGGDAEFETAIQEFGFATADDFRESARQGMIAQRVVDELSMDIELVEGDVQTYFEENQNRFGDRTLEQVRPEIETELRSERLSTQFNDLRRQYGIETYPDRLGTGPNTDGISREDLETEDGDLDAEPMDEDGAGDDEDEEQDGEAQ